MNEPTTTTNPISDFVLAQACEMIKRHEGWLGCAYNDADGYLFEQHDLEKEGTVTIGHGFNISRVGVRLPMDLADEWLRRIVVDMAKKLSDDHNFEEEFFKLDQPKPFPEEVQIVVLDMIYNLGLAGFLNFKKTVSFIINEKYQEAATEMLDSKWAKQVPKRAMELSKIMAGTDEDFLKALEIARVNHETDQELKRMRSKINRLVFENEDLRRLLAGLA
jgi:lysozyme